MATNTRTARPDDAPPLRRLIRESGLFEPEEADYVVGTLDDHFEGEPEPGHRWDVAESEGDLVGVAYSTAETLADRVWNLLFLAVDPTLRGGGHGAALVGHVERELSGDGARILLIETSGTDGFERTRRFYDKLGYTEEARLRGYFGPGDDKVVFWKSLTHDQ